jgi:hypothetical protein
VQVLLGLPVVAQRLEVIRLHELIKAAFGIALLNGLFGVETVEVSLCDSLRTDQTAQPFCIVDLLLHRERVVDAGQHVVLVRKCVKTVR